MNNENNVLPDNPSIQVLKAGQSGVFTNYIYEAIPLAFDESMSYYETLLGLLNYLQNVVIPTVNNNADAVAELQNLYIELKSYVDDYFTNLDVQQEINNKLDAMVESGELTTIIGAYVQPLLTAFETEVRNDLNDIQNEIESVASGSPAGVYATVDALTTADPNHSKIYLVTADGKWYYHNGTTWTAGGTYQGTSVSDNSVSMEKLASDVKYNLNQRINLKDKYNENYIIPLDLTNNLINGVIMTETGVIETRSDEIYYCTPNPIYIEDNCVVNVPSHSLWRVYIYFYDEDFNFIKYRDITNGATTIYKIINTIKNARYIKFRLNLISLDTTTISDILTEFDDLTIENIDNQLKTHIGTNMVNPYKYFVGYLQASASPYLQVQALTDTTYRTTYPIPVKADTTYFISRFRQLILLDSNFEFVSGSYINQDTQNYTLTPSADGYVVFSYNSTYLNTLIMAQSSESVNYVPYKEYLPNYIDLSNLIESDRHDILYNKKYVALGDSFTHGDFSNSPTADYTITDGIYTGQYKVYPYLIGNRNNMDVTNLAVNGMTITNINGTSNNYLSDSILEQIPEDVDYITIKIGINDNPDHQNAPLGTIQSTDRKTFYGAWNYVMNYLISNYPNAKIGIIISNGMTSLDYINAEIEIAKRYGIAYINETTDNNVPLLIRTMRTDVLSSIKSLRNTTWEVNAGTNNHPNAKCHEYESTIIENFMRRI